MTFDKKYVIDTYKNANILINDFPLFFMNHGYYPPNNLVKGRAFENQMTLYLNLLNDVVTTNKSILEIGCGRGGGAALLNEFYSFSEIHACDLSKENIQTCITNHAKDITFKTCDAEALSYDSNYFDIVINVESAHCYQDFNKFIDEVKRVLKPGGLFLITDTYCSKEHVHTSFCRTTYDTVLSKLNELTKLEHVDITDNVSMSCLKDSTELPNIGMPFELQNTLVSIAQEKYLGYASGSFKYYKGIYKVDK